MSLPINITSALTTNISSYLGTSGSTNISNSYPASNGVNSSANTSSYAAITGTSTSSSGYCWYSFDTTSIPSNATINSVSCVARARVNNTSRAYGYLQMFNGTTAKGSQTSCNSTTSSAYTLTVGTWTRTELNDARLRVAVLKRANQTGYVYFYGATLTVNYSVNGTAYEVNVTDNSAAATVTPTYASGMTGEDITISFSGIQDKSEIVVMDNNVDVTNSLTAGGGNTASVGTVAGASYGFSLDGQYYKSQNTGRSGSAALCRLNLDITTPATLTVHFINYAEATYDYGVIGNLDAALGTTTATTSDDYKWIGSSQSDNDPDEQTVTFSVPVGTHFVDFKYRKDNYTDENNDALWFRYELTGTGGTGYQYTISNISADHTIVVTDGNVTKYNVNASSSYAGATVSPATQQVIEGRSADVQIAVNNLYEIVVKDNGTTVTSSLVQNATGFTYTVSNVQAVHNITVEEGTYYTVSTGSTYPGTATVTPNPSKVYAGQSSVVNFDIDHLYAVVAKDNGSAITLAEPQPSQTASFIPNSYVASASTATTGTTNPPSNAIASSSATQNYATFSAQTGANAIVEAVYDFDCSSIPANAVIESVVCSAYCRTSSATYLPTSHIQLYHGSTAKGTQSENINATASGRTTNGGSWTREELNDISLHFVGQRGTSSTTTGAALRLYGANLYVTYSIPCSYTLTNVQTNHTITLEEAPYHTITVNNSYQDATITVDPPKGYYGIDVDVRIEVDDIDEITVLDNNVNVVANIISVSPGLYRYTINAINTNHTITVTESTRYGVTASSTYNLVTIEPTSASVIEGHSQTFMINGDPEVDFEADIIVTDNNVDVTNQVVLVTADTSENLSYALGSFDDVNSVYVGIYNNYAATNAEGTTAAAGAASSASTRSSFYPASGEGSELFVYYGFNVSGIPEDAIISNVSCQAAVGVAYNGSGYSETDLQLCVGTTPKGEATTVNKESAATIYTVDGGSGWTRTDLANVKILMHGVRNDTNSNNDTTGQRDNMNMCGASLIVTYGYPAGCSYTITNVQTSHTIVVSEVPSTYYSVNASSTYNQATITPATQSIRQNHTAKLQISAESIYDIVVTDNGVNVTGELVENETGFTYTTPKVTVAHTIVVSESESFTVTTSSQYAGATITPATQTLRQGMNATTYIEVANPVEIKVDDNGTDVTNELVLSSPGERFEASANLSTFDSVNSDYVGIYNNYDYTNAEGQSSASTSTRSSFYPETGVGSELSVYYDFDEVSGIPAGAVIYNVSAVASVAAAFSGQGYSEMTVQLCIGTTPVGEPTPMAANTTATAHEIDGGSGWTISDISNAKILMHGIRNDVDSSSGGTGNRDNLNIYGATIIVTYGDGQTFDGYTYTIHNLQTGHTVVITENPQYSLTASSQVQGVTITPASATVYGRQSVVFNISGDMTDLVIMDNNVDVTTQMRSNSTGYTYTLSNIQTGHTIIIMEEPQESDYVKIAGQFKKIKGFYKRINGVWTLIEKSAFDTQVSTGIAFYGGVIENMTIGEVESSGGIINISINDGSLDSGTYRMVYEDASRTPLAGYTDIEQFTIQ